MDKGTRGRRAIGNRNRPVGKAAPSRSNRTARRQAILIARNRRRPLRNRRNRLARAQNNLSSTNRRRPRDRFRRFNNFASRRNLRLRIVFVGGLPSDVDNRRLYSLFRKEGRIVGCKLVFNRMGISKGYGFIEFARPRDAWRTIQKWNNTTLGGQQITVEYRKRRRFRRRFEDNSNRYGYSNRGGFNSYSSNYGGFFQQRQGFGFRGRGGSRGGFRGQRRY